MKIISFGGCILISLSAAPIFLTAAVTDVVTREEPLEWTRACNLSAAPGEATVTCGDVSRRLTDIDHAVTSVLVGHEFTVTCRGYRAGRGIRLKCGD